MHSKNRAVMALVALLVLAVGGFLYSGHRKQEKQRVIAEAVKDASLRLRQTLAVAPNAASRGSLSRLELNLKAVDADLETVRKSASSSDRGLGDGAEHYVLSAREILRQQVNSIQVAQQAAASREALIAHMRQSSRRDSSWIHDAIKQKKRVEADYFSYNLALKALTELLWGFPDARKRLAPHIDERFLLDVGPAEDARRLAMKESRRAAEDLDFLRRLALNN
jgi:hypothetical protein